LAPNLPGTAITGAFHRAHFPLASGEISCHNWNTARHLAALPNHSRKANARVFVEVGSCRSPRLIFPARHAVESSTRSDAQSPEHAADLNDFVCPGTIPCTRRPYRSRREMADECVPAQGEVFQAVFSFAVHRNSREGVRQENGA
jgi:hypothetical protein